MSEKIGCGVKYKICVHGGDDCGDAHRKWSSPHAYFKCGESQMYLPERRAGLVAGVIPFKNYMAISTWFCSVECYQKLPENKKIKLENF